MKIMKLAAALAVSAFVGGAAHAATQQSSGGCTIEAAQAGSPTCFIWTLPAPVTQTVGSGAIQQTFDIVAILVSAGSDFAADRLADWFNGQIGFASNAVQAPGAGNGSPSSVPLPAAGWMLLAGLGGLVAMRRRKTA